VVLLKPTLEDFNPVSIVSFFGSLNKRLVCAEKKFKRVFISPSPPNAPMAGS
jgi:hypothetical protein